MRVVILSIILLLAGALAVSAVSKLRSRAGFDAFADALAGMGIVPAGRARATAAVSVTSEVVVLAVLVWPDGAVPGLAAATLLLAAFTVALAGAVRRDATVSCHCFGASGAPVGRRHVLRAAFLSALALGALCAVLASSGDPLAGIGPPEVLTAVAVAGVGIPALVWLDDLVWLFRGASPAP